MSAATSIKNGLRKAGISITILRDSGDVTGEYANVEPNQQVTKPFIKEFFLEALMSYDTVAIPGDVIEFDTSGDRYLLMNKIPSFVKNAVILNDGVLYKCNISGELFRPSGEDAWDSEYRKRTQWETVSGDTGLTCHALQTEPLHGIEIESDNELGQIGIENHELYVSSSFGIRQLDRFQPGSGEYYKVSSVKKRRFPGVDVALLEEDTRE